MKKIVINFLIVAGIASYAFATGGFVQTGVAPSYIAGTDTLFGGVP